MRVNREQEAKKWRCAFWKTDVWWERKESDQLTGGGEGDEWGIHCYLLFHFFLLLPMEDIWECFSSLMNGLEIQNTNELIDPLYYLNHTAVVFPFIPSLG